MALIQNTHEVLMQHCIDGNLHELTASANASVFFTPKVIAAARDKNNDYTPLHWAAVLGHLEVCVRLRTR